MPCEKKFVEEEAWKLLRAIWREQKTGGLQAENPIALLDPANVARLLGLSLDYVDDIPGAERGYRTAGMLDRKGRRIFVSMDFKPEERRFTAFHEIAHFLLHREQAVFRDRPVARMGAAARPAVEAEADHFAACCLMPKNLLRRQFMGTFGVQPPFFIFNEAWAFQLCRDDPDSLLIDDEAVWNRALAIARARFFNTRAIRPLHEQFQVSASAMAYRLVELGFAGNPENYQYDGPAPKASSRPADPLFSPGLHFIDERELETVFALPFSSSRRRELVRSLRAFIAFIRQIGVNCDVWVDGSFATKKASPNDIDLAVFIYPGQVEMLPDERYAELELLNDRELMAERYACDVYVERANDEDRRDYFLRTFGEYCGIAKGIPVVRILR